MSRLASEFRESKLDNTTAYLYKKWQNAIEIPISDQTVACLIEPVKIFELTVLFFEREYSLNSLAPANHGVTIGASQSAVGPIGKIIFFNRLPKQVLSGYPSKSIVVWLGLSEAVT